MSRFVRNALPLLLALVAGDASAHRPVHQHHYGPSYGADLDALTAEVNRLQHALSHAKANRIPVRDLRLLEIRLVERLHALERLQEATVEGIVADGFSYLKNEYAKAFTDVGNDDALPVFESRIKGTLVRLTGIFSNIYPNSPNQPRTRPEYRFFASDADKQRMRLNANDREGWFDLSKNEVRWGYTTHTSLDLDGQLSPMIFLSDPAVPNEMSRLVNMADAPVVVEGEISRVLPTSNPSRQQGPIDSIVVTNWHIVGRQ